MDSTFQNLTDFVREIIDAQKENNLERRHEAFCRLINFVNERELSEFNRGYEAAQKSLFCPTVDHVLMEEVRD